MIDFSDVKQWWIGQYEVIKAQLDGTTVWEKETNPGPFYLTNDDTEPVTITIKKSWQDAPTVSLQISDDGTTWSTLGNTSYEGLSFVIPVGGRKYLRSISANAWGDGTYSNIFHSTGKFGAHGDIMTLLGYNTLKGYDCYQMFMWCTTLTTPPILPASTLAKSCYNGMFYRCTSLTTPPILPASTLAQGCYGQMFYGCTSLTSAPALSATTLIDGCYRAMFYDCTGLTVAPYLPATTLAEYCYHGMFAGCTSLVEIKCNATDISTTGCVTGWVDGVAASGIFYKNANMSSWTTGDNGIPSGWTVQDIQ